MIARLYADSFGRLSDSIEPEPMRFQPDCPYVSEGLAPQQIRDDFASLTEEWGENSADVLRALAGFLPTDTLAEFLDDSAIGRI
jgi:hypothetical protein